MRKASNRKPFVGLALILLLIILTIFFLKPHQKSNPRYVNDPGTPKSWEDDQANDTVISPQEKQPAVPVVTIDFSKCLKGPDSFGFGLGSTEFYFLGIEKAKCHFFMGTEIEDPRWDGHLDQECFVPINYPKDFTVTDSGANLTFTKDYCHT